MKPELLQSMRKGRLITNQSGFSLVEVILASSVFALLVTVLIGAYLYGQESTALAGNRARAIMLAEEGLEATRNIRDKGYANLILGTNGLATSSNQWVFSGISDATDIFTRSIDISSTGYGDNKRKVIVNVTWQQNPQRTGVVSLTSRLTNWQVSNNITMASIFSADTSGAAIDGTDNTKVTGITIQNIGDISIVVDTIRTEWSGAPGGTKIEAIRIGGATVWSGSDASRKTQDIDDVTLAIGASPTVIDFLDFSGNMTGTMLTLTFTMLDLTASTTPAFNP